MKELLRQVHELPLFVKVLLCIPMVDIFYSILRVISGASKNDVVWIVLGVLTIIPGAFFMWIVDVIFVVWKGDALLVDSGL